MLLKKLKVLDKNKSFALISVCVLKCKKSYLNSVNAGVANQ